MQRLRLGLYRCLWDDSLREIQMGLELKKAHISQMKRSGFQRMSWGTATLVMPQKSAGLHMMRWFFHLYSEPKANMHV